MKRYIALLRGINISGKNKVPMAELKKGFETLEVAGGGYEKIYCFIKGYLLLTKGNRKLIT